ncbi:putative structural constituent of ribosome [Trypoxylus dichotomus]
MWPFSFVKESVGSMRYDALATGRDGLLGRVMNKKDATIRWPREVRGVGGPVLNGDRNTLAQCNMIDHENFFINLSTPLEHFVPIHCRESRTLSPTKSFQFLTIVVSTIIENGQAKRLHGISFKKRAPRAIKEVKKFALKQMGTSDVRIDTRLNKQLWSKGIRNVPFRIRVRLSRRRNDDEDSPNKLFTLITYVPVASFKNLQTENVDASQE